MSFILEALKRSQQERALGQVPRIDTGILVEEAPSPVPNPWVLLALGLAGIAVGIALYAVLRTPQVPVAAESLVLSSPPSPSSRGGETGGPYSPAIDPGLAPARTSVLPLTNAHHLETGPTAAALDPGRPFEPGSSFGPIPPGAEAPPPRASRPRRVEEVTPATGSAVTAIPADLIEDIASFKDQLLRERQGAPAPEIAR